MSMEYRYHDHHYRTECSDTIYPKDGVEKEKIIFCDRNDSCDYARTLGYSSDLPVIWGVIIIMRGGVMLYEKE